MRHKTNLRKIRGEWGKIDASLLDSWRDFAQISVFDACDKSNPFAQLPPSGRGIELQSILVIVTLFLGNKTSASVFTSYRVFLDAHADLVAIMQ